MEKYKNKEEYEHELVLRAELPLGFKTGVVSLDFYPKEKKVLNPFKMNLSLIQLENKTSSFGGVFTKNRLPGHPVIHGRKMLEAEYSQGVLINNKISNVRCSGGFEDIDDILQGLERTTSIKKELFFSSSTGIIGWKLPKNEIIDALKLLPSSLSNKSIFSLSKGIMTTDNFPKIRSIKLGNGTITAVAKGAGMVEPNMATMLVFILTDIKISRQDIRESLQEVVNTTFNRISIDSDQSTSDTALIFSSNIVEGIDSLEFKNGLFSVCSDLCQDVVRNGEGTSHVIEVTVCGLKNTEEGLIIGKSIINAPLLKAAIYGNDPNLGRIIQTIGDAAGNHDIDIDPDNLTVSMGNEVLYKNGVFILNEEVEVRLFDYLKQRAFTEKAIGYPEHRNNVQIVVDLNNGSNEVTVYGSDLSYEYVRENADYRS